MTGTLAFAGLGLFAGAYGTMIGAGGGFLIVPALLLGFGFPVPLAVGTSLCAVFANALSGTIRYARQGRVDWKTGLLFSITLIPAALAGAMVTPHLPHRFFSGLFGLLVGALGAYLINRPERPFQSVPEKARTFESYMRLEVGVRRFTDSEGHRYAYYVDARRGLALSAGVGFLSSLLGIGGGILHVPALVSWLRFPAHVAVATSHFMLAISAFAGAAAFAAGGHVAWSAALPLALAAAVGAQAGAFFSGKLSERRIIRFLAAALVLLGIRLLYAAL